MKFLAPDRAVTIDEPLINMKAEFLRDEGGRINWLRTSAPSPDIAKRPYMKQGSVTVHAALLTFSLTTRILSRDH